MNNNKYKSTKKVVVSILEHTTQMLKTEPLEILKNALSCILHLSRLKNIRVHLCPSVLTNSLSASSVINYGGHS